MVMDYLYAKGAVFGVLEVMANGVDGDDILQEVLTGLRNGVPLVELPGPDALSAQGDGDLVGRLQANWFGRSRDALGQWQEQPAFDADHPTSTGYWKSYHGDVEGILRETLVRTVEVALGIDADGQVADATRRWPVEYFWACAHPWVEGWVTWRQHGAQPTAGQVTTLFATPPHLFNKIATDPFDPPTLQDPPGEPPAFLSPGVAGQGMVVVSQSRHEPHRTGWVVQDGDTQGLVADLVSSFLTGKPQGSWDVPQPSNLWRGVDEVVAVDVPGAYGGPVAGLTYDPPP